ncbi:tetratricopeptide repeat-containing sulfotransferase family protein [Vannielia litorea]|uniref:tetratricopeptide repeat-containing sulfotransferase family protein n=1 Tax=Vannielia litorea TaxID=1217970 RepID=UPI001C97CFF3|nr:sulfotransferase [Vannielia litorea]MBY6049140.1 sulfotransferase [Vannielia litorea]MBY6076554.1 sulfotransferase [Vannielia litorea]
MAAPLTPAQIPAAYRQGVELAKAGKLREAVGLFTQITRLRPNMAEPHWQIGRIAAKIGDFRTAVDSLDRAQKLKPKELVVLRDFAVALSSFGDTAREIEVLRRILALKANDFEARSALAIALQYIGDFEEAESQLRRCIALQPKNGVTWRLLASGRKLKAGDPVIGEMEKLYSDTSLHPRHRANLDFALAKAHEDVKDYALVMKHLKRGNDELAKIAPYNPAERDAEVAGLKAAFEGIDFNTPALEPDPGYAPVFVTGIPRSGTTLAEQIVGAHSKATAIGEAREFNLAVRQYLGRPDGGFRPLADLSTDDLAAMRKRAEELTRRRFSFGGVCVDKSVQSWHYIGLIRLIMPNARVIVMQRDPRDNLLSIYKNVFSEGTHKYAYRFEHMVHYLKSHREMMDFWHEKAPGLFTEMRYEALVGDPEVEARRLVEAAGLEWEDQCLEFYAQKQRVSTLSVAQVRQPIYQSSTRAWERYGDDIKPLIDALEKEGLLPDGA